MTNDWEKMDSIFGIIKRIPTNNLKITQLINFKSISGIEKRMLLFVDFIIIFILFLQLNNIKLILFKIYSIYIFIEFIYLNAKSIFIIPITVLKKLSIFTNFLIVVSWWNLIRLQLMFSCVETNIFFSFFNFTVSWI